MEAIESSGNKQYTNYLYGVTPTNGSALFSNDLLYQVQYPDPSTGTASSGSANVQTYGYDALGETTTYTDQNGTAHTYNYDVLGRKISDSLDITASTVDDRVLGLGYAYNALGLPFTQTSFSIASLYEASGSAIVNQVLELYNNFGQLTDQYQSLSGPVDLLYPPSDTQYNYTDLSGGLNDSRLTSIVYPDGRVEDYTYSTSQMVITSIVLSGTTATAYFVGTAPTSGGLVYIQGVSGSAAFRVHQNTAPLKRAAALRRGL